MICPKSYRGTSRRRKSHWKRFLWTRSLIVPGIKALRKEKIQLNAAAIQKDRSEKTSKILRRALGIKTTGAKLHHGACGYYGSWDEALEKSGIRPNKIRRHSEYWTKELVIAGIRALHTAGVPLHVNGIVKDNSPKTKMILLNTLNQDVRGLKLYSAGLRLFGGWYQAIEAAGLNSEAIRRDETFWNKEVIVRGILALREKGISIHTYKVSRDRSQTTTDILQEVIGRPVKGSALYIAAYKKFGGWDLALKASGIKPYEVRNDTKLWPKKGMINAIAALHRAGVPLNVAKIEKDRTPKTSEIIRTASGISATGFKLYRTSINKFDSWDNALLASKLNPTEIRRTIRTWDKPFILRAVKKLHRHKVPLNYTSLARQKNTVIPQLIGPNKCKTNVSLKLFLDAQRQFGSWDQAIEAAGLNPRSIRRDKKIWTKQKIVDSILALDRAKIPMNCMKIQFNRDPKVTKIISAVVGKKTDGASLYRAVAARYGSWSEVVRIVHKNPERLGSSSRYLSKWLIAKSIRNLHKAGFPVNSAGILKIRGKKAQDILRKVTEGSPTVGNIYRAATKRFESWDQALETASLDPSKIRIHGMSINASGEPVGKFISTIHAGGFPLNVSCLRENSKAVKSITYGKVGKVISGYSILSAARKEFGDWELALRANGLDPIEIVRRSKYGWSLSTTPHQIERVETSDGGIRRISYMGDAPKTPEEILENRDAAKQIDLAVGEMNEEDQELTERIFDAILQVQHYQDQKQLIQCVSRHFDGEVTEHKIGSVLSGLAEKIRKKSDYGD